jgi:hypothetical protein
MGRTNSHGVTYKNLWWTSTWPLLLVAVVGAAASGEHGARPAVGAAFLWGSIFAGMYAKNPVMTFREAFLVAARISVPVQAVLGLILFLVLSRLNSDLSLVGVLIEVGVSAVVWSAAWAFFIVRKGRKLAAGGYVTLTPPRADSPSRGRLARVLSTGWGRLAVVAWTAWGVWRWTVVNDDTGSWDADDYMRFALQAFIVPVALALVAWWVRLGFLSPAEREARKAARSEPSSTPPTT